MNSFFTRQLFPFVAVTASSRIVSKLSSKAFVLLLAFSLLSTAASAQFISGYTAARTAPAYVTLTAATQLCTGSTTCPDGVFTITLPWSFNFNGTTHTTVYMSQNGFITFGAAPLGTVYNPLSTPMTGVTGVIAAHGMNNAVTTATHLMRHKNNGTSYSFEWIRAGTGGALAGTHADYMITLFQTTNVIEVWYRTPAAYPENANLAGQVGLRGPVITEFKNLTTLTAAPGYGAVNTATASWGVANYTTVNNGKYTWTPPAFCTPPGTGANTFSFNSVTTSSCNVTFNRGNGDGGVVVVAHATTAVSANPASGTVYTNPSNPTFTNGTDLGSANKVVYAATGSNPGGAVTASVTGLTPGTTYFFSVFEYNAIGNCYIGTGLTGSVAIPVCFPPTVQAAGASLGAGTTSSQVLNWSSNGDGNAGVIVVLKAAASTLSNPVNTTTYTANANFGSGTQIGTGNYVVYTGTGSSVNVTGLTVNSTYDYAVYSYNSAGPCYMIPALTGSFTTANGPMTYTSSTTVQQTGNIPLGASNQALIQVQVVTGPGTSPVLTMSSLTFNTNGSTNITNDITAARIFYTGTSAVFSTSNQFGSDVTTFPGGATPIVVSGSQTLSPGINYFWVAYDASIGGTVGNVLDAACSSVNDGSPHTPTVTAPAGSRPITALATLQCAFTGSSQAITYSTIVGTTLPAPTLVASGTAIDNNNYTNQPIGFNFEFNGLVYTSFGINSNGFLWFGTGTPAALPTFPVISNASANLGGSGTLDALIVAAGMDLWAHPHISATPGLTQINTRVSGSAPNRVLTIEWTGFHPKAIGASDLCWTLLGDFDDHRMDFQVKLYESAAGSTSPGRVEMVYRDQNPFCVNTARTMQIGLRGSSNADYSTRANSGQLTSTSTTNGGANSTTISFSNTTWFNGTNVGVRFQPTILSPSVSPSPTAANACPAVTALLSGSVPVPASPSWQWYKDNVAIPGATGANYNATASGNYLAVASNAGCGRVTPPTAVTISPCSFIITSTNGLHGSISPLGNTAVEPGENQSYTVTADSCYNIADVLVDGVSQGPISSYTFTNVSAIHTISATFTYATPTLSVTPTLLQTICRGQTVSCAATGSSVNYNWVPASSVDDPLAASVIALPLDTTVYVVTGTDANGCTVSDSVVVHVKPVVDITVTPPNAVCQGLVNTLVASSSGSGPTAPVGTYTWTPATGLNVTTGATVIATTDQLTPQVYVVSNTQGNGCTTQNSVSVASTPTGGTVTPASVVVCNGGSKTFTVTGQFGGTQWQTSTDGITWTNAGGVNAPTTFTLTGITAQTHVRALAKTTACYDVASTSGLVSVSATPAVVVTSVTNNSAIVSWTPFGIGDYTVNWSGAAGSGTQAAATSPFTITSLNAGSALNITVTKTSLPACAGTSPGTASTTTLCGKPTVTSVTPSVSPSGTKGLKVQWTAVAGATAYRVYYRPLVMNANWSSVDTSGGTAKTIVPLYAGVPYAVMVAANNCPGLGQLGQPSNVWYATYTAPGPTACGPNSSITAVSNCPNQLTVNLSGGTGVWRVTARRLSPSFSSGVSYTVSSPVVNLSVTASTTGSVWEVFAQTVCGATYGAVSNVEVVTVKSPCAAPLNVVASHPDCYGFTVSWNAAQCSGLTLSNYQVYIKKSTAVNYISYNGGLGDHKTFPFPALSPGIYSVFVRAITCNGSYSAASTVETTTVGGPGCKVGDDETATVDAPTAVAVYPNPTAGQFTVDVMATETNEALRIEVIDALARVVYTDLSSTEAGMPSVRVLELSNTMATGLYTVRIQAGQHVWSERLLLQRD